MKAFKPLLASPVDFKLLDYGNLWASPKLDGIRAIVINGVVLSRKLLPIPNDYVQHLFGRPQFEGFDGELIVGSATSKTVYNDTYSGVMKKTGEPDVRYHVFDHITNPDDEYHKRRERLWGATVDENIFVVPQATLLSEETLLAMEAAYLEQGYEGMMLRAYHGPKSRYKFGRSTTAQGTLLKLKRFSDAEAVIVGVEEEMQNNNEAMMDELGNMKRSSHRENKVGKGRLGALVCLTGGGHRFTIGTGFDSFSRKALWERREELVGKLAKYKHFDYCVKDAPRFPVFLGLRDPSDT